MRLCYRGKTYYYQSNQLNTVDSGIRAKYRGNSYCIHHLNEPVNFKQSLYQYRGIAYIKSIFSSYSKVLK